MRILNRLGNKNKKSKHYQKKYEETVIQDEDVNIKIGTEGVIKGRRESRVEYYQDIKKKITSKDIEDIKNIAKTSSQIHEVFTKMESKGIPLDYAVALGLVEEVDIEAYQNIKAKGLDVNKTMLETDLEEVDESLKMEIMGQVTEVPELKDALTEEELEIESKRIEYVDEYQEIADKFLSDTNEDRANQKEDEKGYQEGAAEQKDENIENESEEKVENTDKEDTVNGASLLKNLAEQIKEKTEIEEKIEKQKLWEEERKKQRELRRVYIIGKDIILPKIDGYEMKIVENMGDIVTYTTSKRNLLVITQYIPKVIENDLLKWIQGVLKGDSKYRIVTLKGNAVEHSLVEETIELTKESIDSYYERNKDDKYLGEDLEGFHDISSFLE